MAIPHSSKKSPHQSTTTADKGWTVIYDNDGINIDSEQLAMRVMDDEGVKMIQKYKPGTVVEKDYIYNNYAGTSTNVIVEKLITKFELPLEKIAADLKLTDGDKKLERTGAKIAEAITIATIDRFKKELNTLPGTSEGLEAMAKVVGAKNMMLCTTSSEERMDVSLSDAKDPKTGENANLRKFFPKGPTVVSGYDVSNKYVKMLGLHPGVDTKKLFIVEDSPSGVSKGRAAAADAQIIGQVGAVFYPDKEKQAKILLAAGANFVVENKVDEPKMAAWVIGGQDPMAKPKLNGRLWVAEAKPALDLGPSRKDPTIKANLPASLAR